ncbi:MAG: alpha-N-arabinofuranosidase [Oscillospiraceae bacterium]|jgi:alpha-N-arabinofuranosidase|nr:alpha-N-arabinofuranosidase [Oscillospiraceae bacterium]
MNRIAINTEYRKDTVSKYIYGHFSEHLGRCIYEGLYVGKDSPIPNVNGIRSDAVAALREMKIPVLRWPGGCFADEYHWKDGIGGNRKRMVNTHWGGVVEDNSFGTHEFLDLCAQLGCEPYINGNLGSGEVAEMQEWVEYMTFPGESPMAALRRQNGRDDPWAVKYFGIGNENWGCGGNMRAGYYADLYRRYATYVRNYGTNKIYKVACGPGCDYGADRLNLCWTAEVMDKAAGAMDGLSLHYYTLTGHWGAKGSATDFSVTDYYTTLKKALWLDEIIKRHAGVMLRFDPDKRVKIIFDEWGTWHDPEPGTNPGFLHQQNTMRDALVAAASLHIFNSHADIVHMANIAQLANVLQAVILTDGEKLVRTPTYHVFSMLSGHQDASLLESHQLCPMTEGTPSLSHSATADRDGTVTLTVANLSADAPAEVPISLLGRRLTVRDAEVLTGPIHAKNTFAEPEAVKPAGFAGITLEEHNRTGTQMVALLPPCSVTKITMV